MSDIKSSTKDRFNKFSYPYFLFESLSFCLRKRIILANISNVKDKKILDVCCGTGSNSIILGQQGAEVVGIDLSDNQIKNAEKRLEKYPSLKVRFQVMDAEKMKFEQKSFDIVICSFGLHELGSVSILKNVIREIKRVLKKRGLFIIVDYNRPDYFFSDLFYRLIYLFEPKETLEYMANLGTSQFNKNFGFKTISEKKYFLGFVKLLTLQNEG